MINHSMMNKDSKEETKLMFQPFASKLEAGFWQQLTNVKLNQLKLNKGPVDIQGSYSCSLSETLPVPCLASFDYSSFSKQQPSGNKSTSLLYGQLTCTNIIQEFNECVVKKKEFIQAYGTDILDSILDGRALEDPEQYLSKVALLVHADLKKYKFVYFFSFPALNFITDIYLSKGLPNQENDDEPFSPILKIFSEDALQMLQNNYDKPNNERHFSRGYFIVKHYKNTQTLEEEISVYPLCKYDLANQQKEHEQILDLYFAFTDPSPSLRYPGWPLRNYLYLIAIRFKLTTAKIIRIRRGMPTSTASKKLELQHSMVLQVVFKNFDASKITSKSPPATTGWELNGTSGRPKQVDLSRLLDPKRLAEDAVNLNLRLMKWRLLPSLELDAIAATKCLILGCGTLGCHISRGLLAWGIKHLTLIDNAKISYSNPVRQSLYTFEDCVANNNNKQADDTTISTSGYKAPAAEASLKKIHPTAILKSYILSIPMPGHHIDSKEVEQTKKDIACLEGLIEQHDVVFLLMDTRESRWLPTVIAMSKQKLVINAAIGFDTFLLQRYGIRNYADQTTTTTATANTDEHFLTDSGSYTSAPSTSQDSQSQDSRIKSTQNFLDSEKLGCYFCNDIVAPGDSTLDRTLDQQCTVSRPGVSMMVSALAVELLASIMSSRKLAYTPAPLEISNDPSSTPDEEFECELGIIPHSIRGNLARYHIYMPTSPAFEKCSACSKAVINAYRKSGFNFLQHVFDDPGYLEEVAVLKDLQNVCDNVWALESDEDAVDDYNHIEKI